MRNSLALLTIGLLVLGLASCTSISDIPKNFERDQNIILFRNDSARGDWSWIPVARQRQMIDSVNAVLVKAGKKEIKIRRWCACDSSLVLLEGPDLHEIKINGRELADGTRPSGGVSGEPPYEIAFNKASNKLIWPQLVGDGSLNYTTMLPYEPKRIPDTVSHPAYKAILSPPAETPFIIAITDSGIRHGRWYTGFLDSFWVNPAEVADQDNDHNGMAGDLNGWDFVHNTADLYDPIGHGTLVTSLAHGQLTGSDWAMKNVRFMHLKTHDEHGKGLLFDNLCAMSYARQKGAKIINASWGFYNPEPSILLTYFIKELSVAGITVVAAAGNADSTADVRSTSIFGIAPNNLRNVNLNPFWPGNYSGSFSNVITATTLNAEQKSNTSNLNIPPDRLIGVCSNQNFSAKYVNIGVLNNQNNVPGAAIPFCEVPEITNPTKRTSGSSYAAPVVTGKLARYAGQTWPTNDREVLFQRLLTTTAPLGPILKSNPRLYPFTTKGYYVFRNDQ